MKLSPLEAQLIERIQRLESRLDHVEQVMTTKPNIQPLNNNHCRVCGMEWSSEVWGYVCNRSGCPSKITHY